MVVTGALATTPELAFQTVSLPVQSLELAAAKATKTLADTHFASRAKTATLTPAIFTISYLLENNCIIIPGISA